MEIRPGVGLDIVRIGETKSVVETRIGPPAHEHGGRAFHSGPEGTIVIAYGRDQAVELIEVPYVGVPGCEATLRGIQLTFRPMSDVLVDLANAGFVSRGSNDTFDFADGFAIWSMASLGLVDIDPSADRSDERLVVEGVSVGAPSYFGF